MIRRFFAAWSFLTIFPSPRFREDQPPYALTRAVPYFPVVGLVLGVLTYLAATVLAYWLPSMVAAAVVVALLAGYSGGLHLDGLADSGDGLLGAHDRQRALDIMRDSRIGAYGAMTLAIVLLVKYACLASLGDAIPSVALLAPLGGRFAMIAAMTLLPYARLSGLGSVFTFSDRFLALGLAFLLLLAGGIVFWGVGRAIAAMLVCAATAALWIVFLKIRLGGATGDNYGAACEFGETAVLLAASALFKPGF
ncbi:MAG: adenosylcobinamide-GDP ribazoletransferase [Planctomycetota bacterium]|jgi:adenosylcobinamide-GDP ribazoletransferase|nr:adenosylcobinamide-GDP ribazoletransferase [Planctomycetota bacterium]